MKLKGKIDGREKMEAVKVVMKMNIELRREKKMVRYH